MEDKNKILSEMVGNLKVEFRLCDRIDINSNKVEFIRVYVDGKTWDDIDNVKDFDKIEICRIYLMGMNLMTDYFRAIVD